MTLRLCTLQFFLNLMALTPSYRSRLGYHSGLLGGIAFLASMALTISNIETHQAIEMAMAADKKVFLEQVVPSNLYDNELLQDTLTISLDGNEKEAITMYIARKEQQIVAVAYETSSEGYAGKINLIMGVNRQGEILGVRVLSHAETPGLGDKIEVAKADWILKFNGLSLNNPNETGWHVKKDGGQFDQFTGATITPRAVVKAVKQGLDFFAVHQADIVKAPLPPEPETKAQ